MPSDTGMHSTIGSLRLESKCMQLTADLNIYISSVVTLRFRQISKSSNLYWLITTQVTYDVPTQPLSLISFRLPTAQSISFSHPNSTFIHLLSILTSSNSSFILKLLPISSDHACIAQRNLIQLSNQSTWYPSRSVTTLTPYKIFLISGNILCFSTYCSYTLPATSCLCFLR